MKNKIIFVYSPAELIASQCVKPWAKYGPLQMIALLTSIIKNFISCSKGDSEKPILPWLGPALFMEVRKKTFLFLNEYAQVLHRDIRGYMMMTERFQTPTGEGHLCKKESQ